jgi:hypothetical protein
MTVAFSVARLTVAVTSSSAPSFRSTRAAHAAQVIPRIESSISLDPGNRAAPVTAADDIQLRLPARPPVPRRQVTAGPGHVSPADDKAGAARTGKSTQRIKSSASGYGFKATDIRRYKPPPGLENTPAWYYER